MSDCRAEVYALLAEQFLVDASVLDDRIGPGDLPAWNSLGHLRLMLGLEGRFGVRFSAGDVMSFENIGDLVALVERKVDEKGGAE